MEKNHIFLFDILIVLLSLLLLSQKHESAAEGSEYVTDLCEPFFEFDGKSLLLKHW